MATKNDKPVTTAVPAKGMGNRSISVLLVLLFLAAASYVGFQIWQSLQPSNVAITSTTTRTSPTPALPVLKLNPPSYQRLAPSITPDPNMGKANPFAP
jgi:hypothetical protein